MIALQTWRRFVSHWRTLLGAGLYAALLLEAVWVVAAAGTRPFAPALVVYTFAVEGSGSAIAWAPLLGLPLGSLLGLVGALAILLLVAPLVQGGLAHVAARVLRQQPVSAWEFWTAGRRHWRPLCALCLIAAGVGAVLLLAGVVVSLVPLLGPSVWLMGAGIVAVALCGHGPYLVVAEGLGAREAAQKAFRMVNLKLVDLSATVVLLLFAVCVLGLAGARAPWGLVAGVVLNTFWFALVPLYLACRYQTNIAPALTPPGGNGSLHSPHPPSGA
ncbi:MAG TPA: hypothetical protein VK464_02820 [Symbiobacteriaceae bacterium]|nr:hypothetical protein [Symbiobacteriaceae bacterium]